MELEGDVEMNASTTVHVISKTKFHTLHVYS